VPVRRPEVRVFLDANVLLAGIVFPRWPWEILRHALRGDLQLVWTLANFVWDADERGWTQINLWAGVPRNWRLSGTERGRR